MKTLFRSLILSCLLVSAAACDVKFSSLSDGDDLQGGTSTSSATCRLRQPIFVGYSFGSSDMSRLYGETWTDVALDAAVETETVDREDRFEPKTLSFHQLYYSIGARQQATGRLGARLDIGGSTVGFADGYGGSISLKSNDSTFNTERLIRTSFFDDANGHAEPPTTSLDLLIKDGYIQGAALTVPVMRRNLGTTFPSYSYTGRNQKLCVESARD
jgi:hypothetical protein